MLLLSYYHNISYLVFCSRIFQILLGYGLLLKLSCKKYRLDPSVEEDDIHFLSYYDQKLYSLGHKSQTNDDYCIEFAQLPSGDVKVYHL